MQRVIATGLSVPTLALLVFPLMFSAIGYGQSGTSSVHGNVTDPEGKAVVGATVTLKNSGRNFLRTQTSNDSGSYLFTSVPPGLYQIEAEVPGFKKLTIGGVRALVDAPTLVDLQLEIGEITEAVTI